VLILGCLLHGNASVALVFMTSNARQRSPFPSEGIQWSFRARKFLENYEMRSVPSRRVHHRKSTGLSDADELDDPWASALPSARSSFRHDRGLRDRLLPVSNGNASAFWVIFATLLLPLEVRILPSYEIVQVAWAW
jgi:hypothetical protein